MSVLGAVNLARRALGSHEHDQSGRQNVLIRFVATAEDEVLFRGGQRESHPSHEGVEVGVFVRADVSVDVFVSAVRCLTNLNGRRVGSDGVCYKYILTTLIMLHYRTGAFCFRLCRQLHVWLGGWGAHALVGCLYFIIKGRDDFIL